MGLEHRRYLDVGFLSSLLGKLPSPLKDRVSAPGESIAAAGFESDDPWFRWRFFDALSNGPNPDDDNFFFVGSKPEPFLINLRDRWGPSKEFFVLKRQTEFDKFLLAVELLNKRQRRFEVLLDVGGNIGAICVPATARKLFSRAIAIEPHPANCRLLRANAALNGVQDCIQVIEAAAGPSDNEMLQLELSEDNWGDHRIFVSKEPGRHREVRRKRIEVPSVRLDSILEPEERAHALIWMDVQGFEGHVLRGARELLADRPPLALEFCPSTMQSADGFDALREAVSHYEGFYDLAHPEIFRPIAQLDDLFNELGLADEAFTDILAL
jgi:FkbM family methyltransferase